MCLCMEEREGWRWPHVRRIIFLLFHIMLTSICGCVCVVCVCGYTYVYIRCEMKNTRMPEYSMPDWRACVCACVCVWLNSDVFTCIAVASRVRTPPPLFNSPSSTAKYKKPFVWSFILIRFPAYRMSGALCVCFRVCCSAGALV